MEAAVLDVLHSGRLSYGPKSKEFESEFARIHDCSSGVLVNSGTSALHLAVQALKIRHKWPDGSKVLVPATTFIATINVLIHNNLQPFFVDVDPDTFNISVKELWKLSTNEVVGIIPVHIGGVPCEMDKIKRYAQARGLRIIEDACEASFSKYKGKGVGSWGDVGCFSFYMAHTLTTGVGGMCTTNDKDLGDLIRSLANHGRDIAHIAMDDPSKPDERFLFHEHGHSFRATELEAALGLAQLKHQSGDKNQRFVNWFALANLVPEGVTVQAKTKDTCPMFFAVRTNGPCNKLVEHLESNGIQTRPLLPLVHQPVLSGYWMLRNKNLYPVAHSLSESAFYIGCHPGLTGEDIARVGEVFKSFDRRLLGQTKDISDRGAGLPRSTPS